jgi:hypothetical protein
MSSDPEVRWLANLKALIIKLAKSSILPKLAALGGSILFACAILSMCRMMVLYTNHQLQQPAIDFAICILFAIAGLTILRSKNMEGTKRAIRKACEFPCLLAIKMPSRSFSALRDSALILWCRVTYLVLVLYRGMLPSGRSGEDLFRER